MLFVKNLVVKRFIRYQKKGKQTKDRTPTFKKSYKQDNGLLRDYNFTPNDIDSAIEFQHLLVVDVSRQPILRLQACLSIYVKTPLLAAPTR